MQIPKNQSGHKAENACVEQAAKQEGAPEFRNTL